MRRSAVTAAFVISCSVVFPTAPVVVATATINLEPGATSTFLSAGGPQTTGQCLAAYHFRCYGPTQIETAYNTGPLYRQGITGAGQTIVIVDSYGSPTIQHDLSVFDQAYGLPAPPSLRVIQPAGPVPPYRPNSNREGWAGETTLDVSMPTPSRREPPSF